ncbi:MAG: sulfite exporter TauE/SafE family protein [Fimbriimonadia bacterium]|jgi:cytochrome c biogenesis protein CcdA
MTEAILATGTAFWLGLLTAVSPCPLATNIAALSFVSRKASGTMAALATGGLYTLGRTLAYTVLGVLLVSGLLSAPHLSNLLQKHMNQLLGPLLILVGMILLGILSPKTPAVSVSEGLGRRTEQMGFAGALFLGVLFALSFCPASAALFFGSLLPVAVHAKSKVLVPAVYGVATGLPVLVCALLLAMGVQAVSRAHRAITRFESVARRLTGAVFVLVGIYYCLVHIWRII